MAWVTPITSWSSSDTLADTDFERIEGNTQFLYDYCYPSSQGSFVATVQGFSGTVSPTVYWRIFSDTIGSGTDIAEIFFKPFSGTSNQTYFQIDGFPSALGLSAAANYIADSPCTGIIDNGIDKVGKMRMVGPSTPSITVYITDGAGAYSSTLTASGTKGLRTCAIRYPLF